MQHISLMGVVALTIEPPHTRIHPSLGDWFTTQELKVALDDGGELLLTLHLKDGLPTLAAGPVVVHPATEGAAHE